MKIASFLLTVLGVTNLDGIRAKEGGTHFIAAVTRVSSSPSTLSSSATAAVVLNSRKQGEKPLSPAFFRGGSKNIDVDVTSTAVATTNDSCSGSDSDTFIHFLINNVRGGACTDSDPSLFAKIGTTTVAESLVLLSALIGSAQLSSTIGSSYPRVYNLPILELIASFLIIFGSSFFGSIVDGGLSIVTNQLLNPNEVLGSPNWYANLQKPSWNPPGWVFPIMWLLVSKPTQLCAVSRIFKYGTNDGTTFPVSAFLMYTLHLALGDAWNKVFFGLECIGWATVVISVFFSTLLASTYWFYDIDKLAGYYMLPTCGWVAIATALQWSIYLNNKKK